MMSPYGQTSKRPQSPAGANTAGLIIIMKRLSILKEKLEKIEDETAAALIMISAMEDDYDGEDAEKTAKAERKHYT